MKKRNFGRGITLAVICLGALLLSACGGTFTMSAPKMLSIVIASPPEKVFNYLKNPQHDSEWAMKGWTITNWQGEGLGATADWVLELEGKTFRGKMVVVDYIPNQKVVDYLTGDAWGTITWLLVPVKGGTKVIEIGRAHV